MDEFGKKLISGIRILDNCCGLVLDADIECNSIRLSMKIYGINRWDMLVTNIFLLYQSMNQSWGYQSLVE